MMKNRFILCLFFVALMACGADDNAMPEATLFVGTTPAGLFQSDDMGVSWQESNQGVPVDVRLVKMMIRWDEALFIVTFGGGIFRSDDEGLSWSAQNQGLAGDALSAYAIASVGEDLFIATLDGVYISSDNGASWQIRNNGLIGNAQIVRTIYADQGNLWIATLEGIYTSVDLGQSWTLSQAGLWGKAFLRHQNQIFFVSFEEGVFGLADQDSIWRAKNNGLGQTEDLAGLTLYSIDNQVFYGAMSGLFSSINGGESWTQESFNQSGLAQEVHSITEFEQFFVLGTGDGLFFSEDGRQSWQRQSLELPVNTLIVSFFSE